MKIITTVGTSLIANSKVPCSSLENQKFALDLFDGNGDSTLENSIKGKENELLQKLKDGETCAEIATLKRIEDYESANIYLLCTETILSFMCGRVIKNYLGEKTIVEFIPGLQITDSEKFKHQGFFNLLKRIREIKHSDDQKVLLNISGGYKALIPPITLLAQLEKIPLYYIYEDSSELIVTDSMPVNFDWSLIEDNIIYLHDEDVREKANPGILRRLRDLKLIEHNSNKLTLIGQMLSEYSRNISPYTKTIFGYFIELKLYEVYAKEFGAKNVEHSVIIENNGDIDLVINPNPESIITVELKPSTILKKNKRKREVIEKLIDRTKQLLNKKEYNQWELWLIVYSYSNETNPDIENYFENICLASNKDFLGLKNVKFKIKHFYIHPNILGKNPSGEGNDNRHIYQEFMRTKINLNDITEIYNYP